MITLNSTGWPASTNVSTGVSIIETQIPLSAFGSPMPHVMRLGFVMTSGSQTVSILADADGNPFLFPGNGGKHRIVGAAVRSFTADGNPSDWAGIAPFANGDSNEANTFRIINVFGFLTKDSAFFRFDAQSHASAPTARNDTYSTPQSTPLSVSGPGVLGNDTDPNNLPLSAIQVSSPDRGALVLNSDGSFTYTPDGAAPGHEVFTYQASNGTQPSNVARVEIRVGQTNHAPNAGDDNYNVIAGGTINAPAPGVLANDTDPDGDSLHAVLRNSPLHGTVTLNNDGSFVYVNDGSSLLDDEFTYVASDGVDVSREATVHIHVGTNDAPPVAVNDDYTVAEGGTLIVPAPGVLANDHDSDTPANQLAAVLSAGPQHGTVTLTPNGAFQYVHDGSETTSDFFTYRVYDHQLFSNIAIVHITITPVNDPPVAVNDAYTALSGTTLNVAAPGILGNDTDPDSPAASLTSSVVTTTANGALTLNANGSFTYIPNAGFFGTDSFTYRTSDGLLQSLPATVTITVDKIPVITSANNVTFTIGIFNTFNVTTNGQPAASITENGALPAGVTFVDGTGANQGTGVLSGTPGPGTAGVYNITFTAMNSHGSSAPQSFTLTVVCPAITVTNPATTTGTANTAFSQTFTQSGGAGAVTFTTVSTLPSGLALATNGTLSGTPTQTGTFAITVKATDSNGCSANGPVYNLVISCQTITVTNPATTTGTINAPFSQQFTQSNAIGATTFTTASTLPTGISLAANGTLSGTPAQTGTFPITVTVTDANGCTGTSAVYNLVINCQTITVTNPATTTGTASSPFSQTFTQSGAIGTATFSTASALPAGLTFVNGTLSGTPTQTGTFPITVSVTDSNGCIGTSAVYNLAIGCQTITVSNPANTTGTASSPFSETFMQSGAIGAVSFTTTSTLPAGLTLATSGVLSGTPTQTGSFPIVVTATDSNGCTGTGATYTLVIGCQTITVTNPAVGGATANSPFSQTFTQSGGIGTLTFTTSSTLPAGITLNSSTGVLSGTPLQTGGFPIVVTVTDANGCTGTGSGYDFFVGCQVITVVNPATTTGTVQAPFSETFTASNSIGTNTFSTGSTLPAGLTLASNGTLSGTPTQNGTFPIDVTVTDGNGCPGGGSTYTLVIACQTITVTNPNNATGTVSSPFSEQFTQTGAVGGASFATASTLPAGLTFSTSGLLSGTPTQSGTFPIDVTVTDGNGCTGTNTTYNLVIGCQTITVINPANATGPAGSPFSEVFTQSGAIGATTFTTSDPLPTGLTLGTNGALSGTPTQGGTFPITVTVTDANGCPGVGPTYNLTITCPTITVTNPATTTATVGAPFTATFTQTGGQGTVNFTTSSTLPGGLTLATNGDLAGTPSQFGSFPIVVTATDQNGCIGTGSTYTLVISCPTITVTNPATTTGTAGVAFSQTFTQTGAFSTATFTTASSLPNGLTLSSGGVLSGTPTQTGSFPIVVTVTDAAGCTGTGATYNLTIACPTITVTVPGTTNGTVMSPFSQTFTQTGAVGTATFTTASTLPNGLTLGTDGTLSGTPMQPGPFPIVVTVTDSNGCTGTSATYNLFIFCQSIPIQPPVNTTGTVGTFYTETFVASNTIGTQTWSTPSTLPNGITLDSASGVLSGTPTQSGSFLILIAVKDSNNCSSSRSFTLTINCQTITVTNPNNTAGTVGAPFSEQFSQTGGIGTTTFSTASTLPAGITLSPAGLLSGTPTQPGTFNIVVTATDSNGCTGTGATYSLVIACNVITVTNPAAATGTVDAPFSQTFTQSGGNGTVTFTLNSGTLPSGLTLSATGVLSGTPGQPGNFPITVKATDANGCSGIGPTYTLVIACQTITVTNPGVTTGTVDAAFSQSFTQSGVGTHTPATFTANGSLPPGLSLSSAGLLSGAPSAPGSFSFTVTVTDVNGCSGTGATYTLVVACQTITVTNPATSLGTYNTAFSQTFTAAGVGTHTPVTWSIISGTLPTGLSLAPSTGILSGTPVQTGSFPITLRVTDANGCSGTGGSYNLQIQPKLQNDSYSAVGNTQLVISGFSPAPGTPTVVNATTLLANDTADAVISTGLSVAPAKGVVSIDPTGHFLYTPNVNASGTDTFTYSGTSNGVTATALVTITFNNMVWFVDNATGSLTNDGRSNTPFKTMTALNAAATNTGDFIYVAKGSGTTTGGYTMKANQTLLGAGVNLSVASGLLFVAGTPTNTPTIGGTLTLASGVTIDGIDMSTGANAFLNITAAVTGINVTARTVTATGGAVNINPSSGTSTGTLTFQTLNSNGGAKGVILRNFTGSLTVNGTGATAGSGGTIQNATNNGIELVNTGNITLKNMNLTNNAQTQTTSALNCGNPSVPPIDPSVCVANLFLNNVATVTLNNLVVSGSNQMGIAGKTVAGLSLVNSNIHDNGDELYEDGLFFKDLTGTVSITGTTVKDNFTRQSDIENYTGSLTLTASGSLFGRVSTTPDVNSIQGFFVLLANSAHLDIDMGTSTIQNNGNGNGLQINLQNSSTLGSAGLHSSMHNMTSLSGNAAHVFVNTASTAVGFFDTVNNAVMVNAALQSIDYFAPGGSLTGIILGNTIGTSGVAASACSAPGAGCDGMTIDQSGSGALSLRIDSNTIQQINTNGIAMGATQTGSLNASIINNTFRQPSGGPNQGNAMLFNVGANSGSTATACLNITGNLIQETSQTWDINGSGASIYFNTKNATVTRLPGYLGTSTNDAAFAAFVQGNNTFNLVGTTPVLSTRFNGSTYAGGPACSVP